MPLFRSKAEDKVRAAGYDPARLPPGQYLTEKWPVLHAGDVAHVEPATWSLRLFGEVEEEVTLDYEQLRALPATEITTDIHCVTRWSRFDAGFRPKMGEAIKALTDRSRAILFGRTTYEMFEPAWSSRTEEDDPGAPFFNDTQKYVVSSTMSEPTWRNSTILGPYDAETIRR